MAAKNEKSEFDAFVKRQQQVAREPVDWAHERDEWLQHLRELYNMIEAFLKDYTASGEIELLYKEVPLNEENIGSYMANQMTVKIGPQEITLKPVGTLLIGAKGRVDVIGPAGLTRFVLVNKDASRPTIKVTAIVNGQKNKPVPEESSKPIIWTWKIATPPPRIEYIELNQESLYRALLEVVNG
jgi:hypothetical protein